MHQNSASHVEPIVRRRMPELDTIRGIAILSVLLFHGFDGIAWLPVVRPHWQQAIIGLSKQGWAGVNLFFVLSGFLITGILLDSVGKRDYYARFYSHRALRILPAYYLMLVVLLAGNYFTATMPRETLAFVGVSVVYLSNLAPMFGVSVMYPLLWSLSVEEHFYLLWPTVVRLISRRAVMILALLICIVEPLLRLYALSAGTELWWAGGSRGGSFRYTWMMADGLALGALLAGFARSRWGSRDNFLKLAAIALPITFLASVLSVLVPQPLAFCIRGTSVNYYALVIIAGALWLGSGPRRAWVNLRPLAFYGYISYGLYLVHGWVFGMCDMLMDKHAAGLLPTSDFAVSCVQLAVGATAATIIAYGSRVTYEEFFLRMKNKAEKTGDAEGAAAAA